MGTITIELKDSDTDALAKMAADNFRAPEQQAAALVHQVVAAHKAKIDKPSVRRGPRSVAA